MGVVNDYGGLLATRLFLGVAGMLMSAPPNLHLVLVKTNDCNETK
jgi:hypothetical protein